MKKITDALEIARELEELSGLSPFRHTRQRAYIDVRATLTFFVIQQSKLYSSGVIKIL